MKVLHKEIGIISTDRIVTLPGGMLLLSENGKSKACLVAASCQIIFNEKELTNEQE